MSTRKTNSGDGELIAGIRYTLEHFYPSNEKGEWILDLAGNEEQPYSTMYTDKGDLLFLVTEEIINANKVSNEYLLYAYQYVEAHKQMNVKSRSVVVEHEDWESLDWKIPPIEIKAQDSTIVGRLGITYAKGGEKARKCCGILVSPDNTYATLCFFDENDKEQAKTAMKDLELIAGALVGLSDTIGEICGINSEGGEQFAAKE